MGQRSSAPSQVFNGPPGVPLWMLLRGQNHPHPQQPIKFQYKCKRRVVKQPHPHTINNLSVRNSCGANNNVKKQNVEQLVYNIFKEAARPPPPRFKSEPNLREKEVDEQFGYEIQDVEEFLTKATIEKPANIPVVMAFPSILYQTRIGGYQAEISLPLGMVVNAIFKNQHWLYVQTPHAEEGYVSFAACLPLGIISPPEDKSGPCWEISTDIFPKPSGCKSIKSEDSCSQIRSCEKNLDKLYLRATSNSIRNIRQTLLVICSDYSAEGNNCLNVHEGDVVVLVDSQTAGWFWVRTRSGAEGFIPSAIAGHGFL